jgi:hypothetical protein
MGAASRLWESQEIALVSAGFQPLRHSFIKVYYKRDYAGRRRGFKLKMD